MIAASMSLLAIPVRAEVLFLNNFDGENGGASAAGFNGFSGLKAPYGPVNLVASGTSGITCHGGTGSCVELFGKSGRAGTVESSNSWSFSAGDTINLSFAMSGNQRNRYADFWFAALDFGGLPVNVSHWGTDSPYGKSDFGADTIWQVNVAVSARGSDPFHPTSLYFTAKDAGVFSFFIGGYWDPSGGVIVDDIRLERTAAAPPPTPITGVPEPASWALLLAGLGLVGATLRRRRLALAI